ncbi:MAG: zf-HC2 domain-containing protein [Dehalobacter sp.]|nr:zf-HC2 domain-containing protein [Dehalobacter sp.]
MTCSFENQLQAYLDGELNKEERKAIMIHLEQCSSCRDQLVELDGLAKWSDQVFDQAFFPDASVLSAEQTNPEFAWTRFSQKISAGDFGTDTLDSASSPIEPCSSQIPSLTTGSPTYLERSWKTLMKKYRKLATGLAAAVLFVTFLMIPQVQTFAGEVLALFRVDKIEIVTFTPEDLQQIENFFESGENAQIDMDDIGTITITEGDFKQTVYASATEAKAAGVSLPASPDGYTVGNVVVQSAAKVDMKLNTETINAAMKNLGSEATFDESLNGKTFSVAWPGFTDITYQGDSDQTYTDLTYTVMNSPEIQAPSVTDIEKLRTTLLQLPFIPENIRSQLAGIDDWQNTLPVPAIQGTTEIDRTEKVTVNGGNGAYMLAKDHSAILLWEDAGQLHSLRANLTAGADGNSVKADLLKLAENF